MPRFGRRILVMDDQSWLGEALGQTLVEIGCSVELAKDGDEAITRFREPREAGRPFDAVLLDLVVRGGMGGREVVGVLKEMEPGLRAALMTGYDSDTVFQDHARFGFQAAISKPFTVESLRSTLAGLLDGAESA